MVLDRVNATIFQCCKGPVASAFCLLLLSCAKPPSEWQEDVELRDGTVMVVSRKTDYVSGGGEWAHNRDLQRPDLRHVKFAYPFASNQQVEWHSRTESSGAYPESPIILDFEDGAPIIISIGFRFNRCPEYRRYTYRNSTWQRELLPATDWGRKSNLLLDSTHEYIITLAQKERMNASGTFPKWRKVIDPSVNSCH